MKVSIEIMVNRVTPMFVSRIIESCELCCPDPKYVSAEDLDLLVEKINELYNVNYTVTDYCCHDNCPVKYKLEFEK